MAEAMRLMADGMAQEMDDLRRPPEQAYAQRVNLFPANPRQLAALGGPPYPPVDPETPAGPEEAVPPGSTQERGEELSPPTPGGPEEGEKAGPAVPNFACSLSWTLS